MFVSEALAATEVFDLEGNAHALGTLWADKPTIAVWLRHYG
jgi:hypothetical protein